MEPGNGIQMSDFQFGGRQNIYKSRPNTYPSYFSSSLACSLLRHHCNHARYYTIVMSVNNVIRFETFATNPTYVFFTNIANWSRFQMSATRSTGTVIIHNGVSPPDKVVRRITHTYKQYRYYNAWCQDLFIKITVIHRVIIITALY